MSYIIQYTIQFISFSQKVSIYVYIVYWWLIMSSDSLYKQNKNIQ